MNETTRTVTLKKMRVHLSHMLSESMLREVDVDWREDLLHDHVIFEFRTFVWAETDYLKSKTVRHPADWKEAFKERWFPKWLLGKYPVEYHETTLVAACLYPEFTPAVPDQEFRIAIFDKGLQ